MPDPNPRELAAGAIRNRRNQNLEDPETREAINAIAAALAEGPAPTVREPDARPYAWALEMSKDGETDEALLVEQEETAQVEIRHYAAKGWTCRIVPLYALPPSAGGATGLTRALDLAYEAKRDCEEGECHPALTALCVELETIAAGGSTEPEPLFRCCAACGMAGRHTPDCPTPHVELPIRATGGEQPRTVTQEPFVSASCGGERCSICKEPASMKIGEEIASDDPFPNRHNLTAYVCKYHGEVILRPYLGRDPAFCPSCMGTGVHPHFLIWKDNPDPHGFPIVEPSATAPEGSPVEAPEREPHQTCGHPPEEWDMNYCRACWKGYDPPISAAPSQPAPTREQVEALKWKRLSASEEADYADGFNAAIDDVLRLFDAPSAEGTT